MRLSRNAIGNLIARYSAILKKCAVINVLVAGLLLGGMHGVALAETTIITTAEELGSFLVDTSKDDGKLSDEIEGKKLTVSWGDSGKTIGCSKTLDLNNNTLSGSGYGIFVSDATYTLTVRGGIMSGFGTALYAGNGKLELEKIFFKASTYGVDVKVYGGSATIGGSTFTVGNGHGVKVEGGGSATIEGSTFTVDGGFGVSLYNASSATIEGSTFTVDSGRGVSVGSGSATIESSTFTVNSDYGVFIDNGSATIESSTFTVNSGYGVSVGIGSATIESSTFTGNGTGIFNGGTLTFSGVNTVNSIGNAGTVINNGTLTLKGNLGGYYTTYGTLTNTGILNMAAGATATVKSLAGDGNLAISVGLKDDSNTSKITVGYEDEQGESGDVSGIVNLTSVNVTEDGSAESVTYIDKYVDESTRTAPTGGKYQLNGNEDKQTAKLVTSTIGGTYTFTLSDTNGQLKVKSEDTGGFSLDQFINGQKGSGTDLVYCPADTYSVTGEISGLKESTTGNAARDTMIY